MVTNNEAALDILRTLLKDPMTSLSDMGRAMAQLVVNKAEMMKPPTKWVEGAWPDNLCSGFITYDRSTNQPFEGRYILRDANHGIPVFGSVSVSVFNYPKQTEQIARRLVLCWNAAVGTSDEELEAMAKRNAEQKD
jgi:hypothetical protein